MKNKRVDLIFMACMSLLYWFFMIYIIKTEPGLHEIILIGIAGYLILIFAFYWELVRYWQKEKITKLPKDTNIAPEIGKLYELYDGTIVRCTKNRHLVEKNECQGCYISLLERGYCAYQNIKCIDWMRKDKTYIQMTKVK